MKESMYYNLKALREMNNFTQEAVSNFLGIKRSTYSNYELGDREIPIEILEKLSDLYGCDMFVFFEKDESVVNDFLTCAFRVEGVEKSDLKEIAYFKSIVRNSLKMDQLLKS